MGQAAPELAILAGSVINGVTAPTGQKLRTFAGSGDTDPITMAHEGKGLLSDFLTASMDRAAEPVTMRTTVNPLPNFVGGGLPMAISAPGMDANRLNPALRTIPGINIPRRTLSSVSTAQPGGEGGIPVGTDPSKPPTRLNPPVVPRAGVQNYRSPSGGYQLERSAAEGGDDSDAATAAITLLKKAGLQF